VDRAERIGQATLRRVGDEIRAARLGRGLSLASVAGAVRISEGEASRIERGMSEKVPYIVLARLSGAVGLDLVARTYSGATGIRDAPSISLLADFARLLHPSLRWDTEVPLPIAGDQRAWDGMVRGDGWRFGAEAETSPRDGQSLVRRIQLKLRDGSVDGVVLLLRDTRTTRLFLTEAESELRPLFPMTTRTTLGALRRGAAPPGNGVVIVPRSSATHAGGRARASAVFSLAHGEVTARAR
jgi:transcriptional regulator with XRE-family HTH domain